MLRINNLKIRNDLDENEVIEYALNKYHINKNDIINSYISKKSIDARKKDDVHYTYSIDLEVKDENKYKKLDRVKSLELPKVQAKRNSNIRPVIIGAGPAGLFAALTFVQNGIKPIVIEQGKQVEERVKDVEDFKKTGKLNTMSNVQFGEGGAGTFSDGKLTTGINSPYCKKVLQEFVNFGAPSQILYLSKPHIGTDVLRKVVVNLRKKIISLGGEIRFDTRLTDIVVENGRLSAVKVQNKEGENLEIPATVLVLAIGHSARDTFKLARDRGLPMEQKPFSIGVRMEHPQEMIDRSQYGEERRLPPADYKLSYKASNGRGVYSFCMCPGGQVIPCASEPEMLCVNGMSNRKRDSGTANSGILCDVRTEDFGSDDVLAGVEFQRKYERLCFQNGGGNYKPPKSTMKEFLENTGDGSVVINTLPEFAADAIREAVPFFAKKIKGYDRDDGVVTAVETRSSSPVRILRDKSMESQVGGIYPAGEGAGYAGGIVSSAIDGERCAEALFNSLSHNS